MLGRQLCELGLAGHGKLARSGNKLHVPCEDMGGAYFRHRRLESGSRSPAVLRRWKVLGPRQTSHSVPGRPLAKPQARARLALCALEQRGVQELQEALPAPAAPMPLGAAAGAQLLSSRSPRQSPRLSPPLPSTPPLPPPQVGLPFSLGCPTGLLLEQLLGVDAYMCIRWRPTAGLYSWPFCRRPLPIPPTQHAPLLCLVQCSPRRQPQAPPGGTV